VTARPARERQRSARADHVEAPVRVERVSKTEQVVLVGATSVVEDEQAGRIAVRRALAIDEGAHLPQPNFGARTRTERLER
jgi:hypothetical protein